MARNIAIYRILPTLTGELLMTAAQREFSVPNENLYLRVLGRHETRGLRHAAAVR